MAQNDQALLTRLQRQGIEFVIIGGVCVVYHGVPMATFDLDICCRFGEENVSRIESAVSDLHPVHRFTTGKLPLHTTRDRFADFKNLYLQTDLGKLDCLSEVAGIGTFDEAFRRSVAARFSYGEFRFLGLDALIEAKIAAGREHDLAAVKRLRAVKERLESRTTS
ncbi:MAG: nucleotidyltransferase [Verrucomicrobia bacterium]|nr:nucleotidyltransferase [Verrucomicrobiota bacterium]